MAKASSRESIIEFIAVGKQVKVSALDVETGIEVSIVGSKSAGRAAMQKLALQKLEYVLKKKGMVTD